MKPIHAIPYRTKVLEYLIFLAGALFFGGLIGTVLIIIHEIITPITLSQSQRYIYLTLGTVASSISLMVFLIKDRNKYYWELNENYLIRGYKDKLQFRLEDIEKIIVGIPEWSGLLGKLTRIANPIVADNLNAAFQSSLIIKMKDNTFIPLNIHTAQNGTDLMVALLERLKEKIDKNYEFSQKEKRLLQRPKWNSVTTL